MKTMLTPETAPLYFQKTPLVTASRESLENAKLRRVETYFFERLGPDYKLPYTKFPASLYKALVPLFRALEKEHPDWLYKHYVLLAHTETPANIPGEADVFFYLLLEDPRSNRLLSDFFKRHIGDSKVVDKFINSFRGHSDMMDKVYQDASRHQTDPKNPRYFIINTSAL